MKNKLKYFFLFSLLMIQNGFILSQNWEFVKEKDNVKLYSRQESGKNLKIVKGVAEINVPAEKVFALLENVNSTEWWDDNLSQIKVLHYEKNKNAQYYLVYKMPWPFKDRDLCVDVNISINKTNGEFKINAVPLSGIVPEKKDLIRIKDYKQVWTVRQLNNRSQVELEFYVDPIDNIPIWFLNMVMIDSPIISINNVRRHVVNNKSSGN